jgi:hypothetical protein
VIALVTTLALAAAPRGLTSTFPAEGITHVALSQGAGSVHVRTDAGVGMIEAIGVPLQWDEGCAVDAQQSEEKIRLTVDDPPGLKTCHVDWTIVLPPTVAVTLAQRSGVVKIEGLSARLDVDLGNGDVVLTDVTGPLAATLGMGGLSGNFSGREATVRVGKGGVHLEGLIHPVDIEVGLGNIGLTYGLAPRGEVNATTGAGQVTVLLPPATPVAVLWERVIGPKRIELTEDANAPTRLTLGAGVGNVLVDDLNSERGRKRARVDRSADDLR